tara:strand:+ start:254 stop:640 length:387 start_codon:yes stop_codon:yes gene_type:complete
MSLSYKKYSGIILMKNNITPLKITFVLLGLLAFIIYINYPFEFKQFFIFGVEQFKEHMDKVKNTDDTIKVNIPIYNKKEDESKQHPGYCFIGESDYTRHCVELKADDNCVSGQKYKSKEVCVNPDLRY